MFKHLMLIGNSSTNEKYVWNIFRADIDQPGRRNQWAKIIDLIYAAGGLLRI